MNDAKYIGMDVHTATISAAVRDSAGNRSVQVGRPQFNRCCYLIIDLGSYLFDESWART
jgi:hypothetical protein